MEKTVTENTANGPQQSSETILIYKGIFGVFSRDYSIQNGSFYDKTEIKIDVMPAQPLHKKVDFTKDVVNLIVKIHNPHTPKQCDYVKIKRYDPNGYRKSIILIGNLTSAS